MSRFKRMTKTLTATAAALATMFAGLAIAAPAAQANTQVSPEVARLFQLTNEARVAQGLKPVKLDTRLTAVAQDWSQTQARQDRMYHRPNFGNSYPAGWQWSSENVAFGHKSLSADIIFDAWMKSPGHYKNIMHSTTTHVGIGWAGNGTNNYATQNFARYTTDPSPVINPGGFTGSYNNFSNGYSGRGAFHLTNYLTAYSQSSTSFGYGNPGEEFIIGDWDGDGKDTIAIRRGNTYHFANTLSGKADFVFSYGDPGDEVLVGDWNGDGKDTLAVRKGNRFYIKNSFNGGYADFSFAYGDAGDTAYVGDWNGDGKDTLAVRKGNRFYMKDSFNGGYADYSFAYGDAKSQVLVGDWDGDGKDTLAVRVGNAFHIKNYNFEGPAQHVARFGDAGDPAFAGDWAGGGKDTVGVRK